MSSRRIELRGVRVHNLKQVDLDLPQQKLIAFCGVSGSGKTSLAFDTLYAEGQRRYVETFSAATRQFLEQLEKPEADRIEGLPPAIAVARSSSGRDPRVTVGGATEIDDYLRLLLARVGRIVCPRCDRIVERHSAATVVRRLAALPTGTRFLVAFPIQIESAEEVAATSAALREGGFVRAVVAEQTIQLASEPDISRLGTTVWPQRWLVAVDRLVTGEASWERAADSLETAFDQGVGEAVVMVPEEIDIAGIACSPTRLDGQPWRQWSVATTYRCGGCQREFPAPDPRRFNCQSPLGACPTCKGTGVEREDSPKRGRGKSLDKSLGKVPGKGKGKGSTNSSSESAAPCPACQGTRLGPDSLATRLAGLHFADFQQLAMTDVARRLDELELSDADRAVGRTMLDQLLARLRFLNEVGLGYLRLERPLATLSGGEAQRVALTSALGSSLVNMLYVLDEPTVGLHRADLPPLVTSIQRLRDRGNTVVMVEHEEELLRAADLIVELGPEAGERGGRVTFQGSWSDLLQAPESRTGDFLAGRRVIAPPATRRVPNRGWLKLVGARGRNLRGETIEFPLGVLCLVTGVSGSGKSTLVQDTLYAALCQRKKKDAPAPLPHDDLYGDSQIDDVILVDTNPVGRTPRSNPVTYVKAFDEIRQEFAETLEARTHNYSASHFSFNVDGGRCPTCGGDGYLEIDMQFMADVFMKCGDCHGTRYRREILEVRHRGRHIAEILDFTVREAFAFFRGQTKVQEKLKRLMDVGLDYIRLGQPANTLSAGESQRLKLASHLAATARHRTLFILDEPTAGLHRSDIVQLLDCFESLLAVGHSLMIVEHNLHLMKAADYLIDLGPGAAELGGRVVAQGSPEVVAQCRESATGRCLANLGVPANRLASANEMYG